jgi:hypothetical protein
MQPITLLGLVFCFCVLGYRMALARKNPSPRNPRQILKTARTLFGALLVLLVVYYNLHKTDLDLDRKGSRTPSTMEKVVRYLSK